MRKQALVQLFAWGLYLLSIGGTALGQPSAELLEKEQQVFQAAAARAAESVVQIETFGGMERVGKDLIAEGPTTGTILSPDGWIISSLYSFRQQPASILVTLPDGSRVPARIVARDHSRELTLLKVDGQSDLPIAEPSSQLENQSQPQVGAWVIALGKTYDRTQVSQSIGIISAFGRAYDRAIQTDAKISPINYGGPLIDLQGKTLGILAPISPGTFFEGDGSQLYDSGVGFAIPLSDILARLPRMQEGIDIYPGKLGIVSTDQNELAGPVEITGTIPGSPAAKAGVQPGDILIEAEGQPIHLLAQLRHALSPIDADQPFHFTVLRDGERIELSEKLIAEIPVYERRYMGLRIKQSDDGAFQIVGVEPNSPASKVEIRPGQQLRTCDGQVIGSLPNLRKQLAVAELDKPLNFGLSDENGQPVTFDLLATTWPSEIPASIPDGDPRIDDTMPSTVVDINLGDFPNKAYALIPPLSDQRPLGLLIVFPEPGELDREKTKNAWDKFSRQYGWIVAVLNSGNPRRWSMEELELPKRIIGRMQKGYDIDHARTAFLGLGVGGRVAIIAASMSRDKVNAVVTVSTTLDRFQVRQRNAPLQSLDYLMIGSPDALEKPVELLRESGYATTLLPAVGVELQKWETFPMSQIEFWLEGLARF